VELGVVHEVANGLVVGLVVGMTVELKPDALPVEACVWPTAR
jgi:hypothetical protein